MKNSLNAIALCGAFLWPITCASASEPPRYVHFQRKPAAIVNGETVLAALQKKADRTAGQRFVGSQVVFIGSAAPPGDSANLVLEGGVTLQVVLTRKKDVRPHAVMWDAEVFGKLTKIDFEHRVITISCQPNDWRLRQTF